MRGWPGREMADEKLGWLPPVDVINRKAETMVRMDLPGLEEKDIEVRIEDNVLTVRGQRQGGTEDKGDEYYKCERWAGAFSRSLVLPPGIDADKIKAIFTNGVLEITFPKTKEAKGKKIDINTL
jgi:HSP20 family protein